MSLQAFLLQNKLMFQNCTIQKGNKLLQLTCKLIVCKADV